MTQEVHSEIVSNQHYISTPEISTLEKIFMERADFNNVTFTQKLRNKSI